MSFREDYKGVEGKTRYLQEVLVEYDSSEKSRVKAMKKWARHGGSPIASWLVQIILLLGLVSVALILAFAATGSPAAIIACIFCLFMAGIVMFFVIKLDEKSNVIKHTGWFRSYEGSLTGSVEVLYRSLTKASYDIDVYRGRVESGIIDARGTIFRIPKQSMTVTLIKRSRAGSRVIAFIETTRSTGATEALWLREVIDRALLADAGETR